MSQVTTTTTYVAPVAPPYGVATSQAPPTYQMQGAFVQPNSESSPLLLVTETQSVPFGEVYDLFPKFTSLKPCSMCLHFLSKRNDF